MQKDTTVKIAVAITMGHKRIFKPENKETFKIKIYSTFVLKCAMK